MSSLQNQVDSIYNYAKVGHTERLTEIFESSEGIDNLVNMRESKREDTALCIAAGEGFSTTVQLLLDWGAKVDACNGRNETPLMRAASEGQLGAAYFKLDMSSQ